MCLHVIQVHEHLASAGAAPELQSFAAANPGHCHSHSVRGNVLDPPATASSSHLDTGKELTNERWRILWDAVECTRKWEGGDLLSPATRTDSAPFTLQSFTTASVNGSEQVQSEDHQRSRSKVSHYVLVRFRLGDQWVTYVASVRFFVRATHTASLLRARTAAKKFAAAERLAVVRLYNVKQGNAFWGTPYVAQGSSTQPPKPAYDAYVVKLASQLTSCRLAKLCLSPQSVRSGT